jgi:hypothetical protein
MGLLVTLLQREQIVFTDGVDIRHLMDSRISCTPSKTNRDNDINFQQKWRCRLWSSGF